MEVSTEITPNTILNGLEETYETKLPNNELLENFKKIFDVNNNYFDNEEHSFYKLECALLNGIYIFTEENNIDMVNYYIEYFAYLIDKQTCELYLEENSEPFTEPFKICVNIINSIYTQKIYKFLKPLKK